ncbi:MAG: hypothetical protein KGL99_17615 [Burkholderiales bacterium]|nr:hypothetical protein [Burkholderiales bacterium]MDE2297958.1 hypothetical protein [Burkholderiales bacterium]MDE2628967.1 hypothetical protein [Burkholderiales bacterium]
MDELTGVPATTQGVDAGNGVADAVLREVARLLRELAGDPRCDAAIDLNSLPLGEGERERLRRRLGRGEVEAAFDLAGPTRITETAYAGVWWVRHADVDDRPVLEHIVVARVPALLLAHPADIEVAARRIGTELAAATCQEKVND